MKYLKSFCLVLVLLFLTSCRYDDWFSLQPNAEIDLVGDLKVHYLDVGQGDSIFIELPNNETMLIDAGEKENASKIENYLQDLNYDTLNYVIGTHPHTDHIGALATIIQDWQVQNIYLPKAIANTKTYENLLLTIKNKGLTVHAASQGLKIIDSPDLQVYFLAPVLDKYTNLNNYSAVLKIVYQDTAFLFMGDAEALVEKSLNDVQANVIKVGHHGSDSSSSLDFVQKVGADYAIISVGANNQYNHPSLDVIARWQQSGSHVYRTDLNGNIIVSSDGKNITVQVEKEG